MKDKLIEIKNALESERKKLSELFVAFDIKEVKEHINFSLCELDDAITDVKLAIDEVGGEIK